MGKTTKFLNYKTEVGENITFPAGIITGKNPGPHFVITAGIHGAEYPGIVAAIKLFKGLNPEEINGEVTIITISNLRAFESRSMFVCPVDNKNPNRFFPGKEDGSYTEAMAFHLFEDIISKADYYMDLHGGDMVESLEPFTIYHEGTDADITKKSKIMAEHFLLPDIVGTKSDGYWPDKGTTYANASEAKIPAIIAEVGGIGQLDQLSVDTHVKGVMNVLRYFKCLEGEPVKPRSLHHYSNFIWLNSPAKGVFYSFIKVGDFIKEHQILGCIEDYFGNHLVEISAPVDGKVLFLTTSPAMDHNGLIMGIGAR